MANYYTSGLTSLFNFPFANANGKIPSVLRGTDFLHLYTYFKEKKLPHILMKVLVTVAGIVWCSMLRIDDCICCVLITIAFWGFRKKPMIRNLMAGGAAMVCCLFSLYYLAAPLAMLVVHFYNGEEGEGNRPVNYLFYPVVLTLLSVAGVIAFGF